jgi:hypothetical protein
MYVLACFLVLVGAAYGGCSHQICDTYYNSRAYTLSIATASGGVLSGTYQHRKSNASYVLVGTYSSESLPCTVGWSVSGSDGSMQGVGGGSGEYSTSWSGLATLGDPGRCTGTPICDPYTVYLVVQYHVARVVSPEDYWESTSSGLDVFWNESTTYPVPAGGKEHSH